MWADIYTTSGTSSTYSYDDNTAQPGSFNEYRLKIFDMYEGVRYEGTAKKTDGFCLATGVVSGRITYGSGTAVEGVKITLGANNADGESVKSNRSCFPRWVTHVFCPHPGTASLHSSDCSSSMPRYALLTCLERGSA